MVKRGPISCKRIADLLFAKLPREFNVCGNTTSLLSSSSYSDSDTFPLLEMTQK